MPVAKSSLSAPQQIAETRWDLPTPDTLRWWPVRAYP
jgi:hypothetical protein